MSRYTSLHARFSPLTFAFLCLWSPSSQIWAQTNQSIISQIAVEGSARFSNFQI
jgi:hypothetical protein